MEVAAADTAQATVSRIRNHTTRVRQRMRGNINSNSNSNNNSNSNSLFIRSKPNSPTAPRSRFTLSRRNSRVRANTNSLILMRGKITARTTCIRPLHRQGQIQARHSRGRKAWRMIQDRRRRSKRKLQGHRSWQARRLIAPWGNHNVRLRRIPRNNNTSRHSHPSSSTASPRSRLNDCRQTLIRGRQRVLPWHKCREGQAGVRCSNNSWGIRRNRPRRNKPRLGERDIRRREVGAQGLVTQDISGMMRRAQGLEGRRQVGRRRSRPGTDEFGLLTRKPTIESKGEIFFL
jgi:hypothetical protein